MRALLGVVLFFVTVGCLAAAGWPSDAPERALAGARPQVEWASGPREPGQGRRCEWDLGSATAIEVGAESDRLRRAPCVSSAGPPAFAPSTHPGRFAPPRRLAERGLFPSGELPPAQSHLRVNGSANAHGARA